MSSFKKQVNIVESSTPPTNKNDWWYDTNIEVLKRYSGGTWEIIQGGNDTSSDTPSDTPIETTYEEAKALYESGKMTPGQKYKFEFKKQIFTTDTTGLENGNEEIPISIINIFPLEIWIDRSGQLRAEGTYKIRDSWYSDEEGLYDRGFIIKHFKSKYSFNNEYIPCNVHVKYDEATTSVIETYTYDDYAITDGVLAEFLQDNGFIVETYVNDNTPVDTDYEYIIRDCIVYHDEVYIYNREDDYGEVRSRINYINRDGIHVAQNSDDDGDYGDPYIIDQPPYLPEVDDLNNTGYLYDLEFGNYKHSQLIDGEMFAYDEMVSNMVNRIGLISIDGDVDNRKQDIIFAPIWVKQALIKNTNIPYPSDHLEDIGSEGYHYQLVNKMVTNNIKYFGSLLSIPDECITDNQQCFTTIYEF